MALKLVVLVICLIPGTWSQDINDVINQLLKRTEGRQVMKSKGFFPFISWQEDLGVYPSNVKINFHGASDMAFSRDKFKVFDNNMFTTAWVTSCLVEAYRYGDAPKPSMIHMQLALESINGYRNKERHFENSVMSFWPQVYNKNSSTYISTPTNLLKLFDIISDIPMKLIEKLLKEFGFPDISQKMESLLSQIDNFRSSFHIPPDFDDTFVNLGLGSLLTDLKDDFPEEHASWLKSNGNISTVFDALKKYAYQPFSNDPNTNTIDPRSYFYLSSFLEDVLKTSEDLALIPTWIQNIDETRVMRSKGVSMPFNINNVDMTVSANVIYGITSAILSGIVLPDVLNDVQIQKVYLNTTNMIAYQMMRDFSDRRDLALTYYPSVLEFYWFVARTVFLLNEKSKYSQLPHQDLVYVLNTLEPVLKGHVTKVILNEAKSLGTNMTYFDDFLGDGDYDQNNKTEVKGEDRIFTTAMAVNALIATWSIFDDKTSKLHWKTDVPADVKSVIFKSVNWLMKFTLSGDFKPLNTFFSGSVKGFESLPFFFPINRLEYLNGTQITDYSKFPEGGPFILGIQGVVPKSQYHKMVYDEKHFGRKTPTKFAGFNSADDYFPFWSSEPYTYATTMLALAQFNNFAP